MLSETSGDFVVVEHPTRVVTTSSASKLKHSLSVFISLLEIRAQRAGTKDQALLLLQHLLDLSHLLLDFSGRLLVLAFGFKVRIIGKLSSLFLYLAFQFVRLPSGLVLRAFFHEFLLCGQDPARTRVAGYCPFDCTGMAKCLCAGNLLSLRAWMQEG